MVEAAALSRTLATDDSGEWFVADAGARLRGLGAPEGLEEGCQTWWDYRCALSGTAPRDAQSTQDLPLYGRVLRIALCQEQSSALCQGAPRASRGVRLHQ